MGIKSSGRRRSGYPVERGEVGFGPRLGRARLRRMPKGNRSLGGSGQWMERLGMR